METNTILLIVIASMLFIGIIILVFTSFNQQKNIENEIEDSINHLQNDLQKYIADYINASITSINNSTNQANQFQLENLKIINTNLHNISNNLDSRLDNIRTSLTSSLQFIKDDNNKSLSEIRTIVSDKLQETLDNRFQKSFQIVSQQLEEVNKGLGEMQNLASGVGDLKKVLTNVKQRGILGEIQLSSILQEILSPSQYDTNINTIPNSKERVEFAVKMPGENGTMTYLPIDAKFPADSYLALQQAIESADKQQIENARKNLITTFKNEAKDIHNKYIAVPYTTDFGIMFLPTEGLYATACDLNMLEILQKDYRITIAGPSTMAALLNALQMGFRTLTIQKRSNEVWQLLSSVKKEFTNFADVLAKAQRNIQLTSEELDKLVGTRTRAINQKLKAIEVDEVANSQLLVTEESED